MLYSIVGWNAGWFFYFYFSYRCIVEFTFVSIFSWLFNHIIFYAICDKEDVYF